MKILRVLRRRKIRLSFVLIFLLVFIFNSYAWISYDREVGAGAFTATVSSWGVEFIISEEDLKTEQYTYEIEEFHPGIEPIEKKIYVYNVGEKNSDLEYRISEIYLYGEQILKVEDAEGELVPETAGKPVSATDGTTTVNAFGNQNATIYKEGNTNYSFSLKYPTPFTITYTYDKDYIYGSDGGDNSKATMTINLAWDNDEQNNEEDTKIGSLAYDFKLEHPDEPPLKIVAKVIAKRAET